MITKRAPVRVPSTIRRMASLARSVYRNRRRLDDLPRMLTYTVTFGCNARCIMCDSWKLPTRDDLKLEQIETMFEQLPAMDAVRLTGGEPFVRKDFGEIVQLSDRLLNPWLTHVTTNGFLTERIVDFCQQRNQRNPMHLLVSVDGVGQKHNEIRGNSNAWDLVMETVRSLAPRQKELNLKLAVNQTIVDEEGMEHYHLLRETLQPYGVYNQAVLAYDVSATYSTTRDLNAAPEQAGEFTLFGDIRQSVLEQWLDAVEQDIQTLPAWQRWSKKYYLEGIRNRVLHGVAKPNPPCVALNSHLRIFPNGDVPTCQFNSRIVGNLTQQSFEELWHSAKTVEQRNWVRKCHGCWAECEVLPSAIYSLDSKWTASRTRK